MKVLYELIEASEPKKLWDSLNLTTQELTHERVDAFLAVYQKVMSIEPEYSQVVLERVDIVQPGYLTFFLALGKNLSMQLERIEVKGSNLNRILSLHIPSKLYDVCQTTVINELFRCLITEELRKPEYYYKWLRRQMIDELDHNDIMWADKCMHNRHALEKAKESIKIRTFIEVSERNARRKCLIWGEESTGMN